MNAFLFTGLVSEYHHGQFVDACSNVIVYGADEPAARRAFEEGLLSRSRAESPDLTRIEQVAGTALLDQVLTETGPLPANWPQIVEESARALETAGMEEQDHGYWVDCEQAVSPDGLATGIAQLERELPDDIRSGLNWSAEKTYFFLISVLSPPARYVEPIDEFEPEMDGDNDGEEADATVDLEQRLAAFPQLAKKETAVVVRARNSVVAAWLWRRQAAGTPLARNAIRLDALCVVVSGEESGKQP